MSNDLIKNLRVGQGIDIHPFEKGRKLIIGGVEINFELGLKGHSDADVLLHAVTDAVLGALGWGDIGQWFPPSDQQYKDIDSKKLFSEVWDKAHAEGWSLVNCDCVLLAEFPKLKGHTSAIKKQIAELFRAEENQIGVKATTTEKLGFVGRGEGIMANATVLLFKG